LAPFHDSADAIAWLRTPAAIRERCGEILVAAERGALEHFAVEGCRLSSAVDYVVETMLAAYPGLDIPYHSRWRHFSAGGVDRWGALSERLATAPPDEVARVRVDLAVVSVLLDAGAGARWSYREPGGDARYRSSEGLAVASFHLFASGVLSATPDEPLRVDAAALAGLDDATLAAAFQVGHDNPLVGLDQRTQLLRRLGGALAAEPELFAASRPRIGNMFDYLAAQARDGRLPATTVLGAVLRGFGAIWPARITLGGVNLGDVGRHPTIRTGDLTDGLVPFHKLSQWLAYSLVEPLEDAGIVTTELDALTGLAEYRNGGLLVDLGVLRPKHDRVLGTRHCVDSEVIVEWRALTVALLDRLAGEVRAGLDLDAAAMPLAKVLEGGTWRAGRRIAHELRRGGEPPIRVASDGTVF
jgi:hypothetical protein